MAKKNKRPVHNLSILSGDEAKTSELPNNQSGDQISDKKPRSFRFGLIRGERVAAVALCLLLVMGALGAGLGDKIISTFSSKNAKQVTNQTAQNNGSNPYAAPSLPTATPQLSKEIIYAGGRMLAVVDANAPAASPTPTPTPTPQVCTPFTTVTEGDLFPGGIASFGVSSGPGSVIVDHVNSGSGLQLFTVVGTPINGVVVTIPAFTPGTLATVTATFTRPNPGLPLDFTLRAASTFHAINIRVRCLAQ